MYNYQFAKDGAANDSIRNTKHGSVSLCCSNNFQENLYRDLKMPKSLPNWRLFREGLKLDLGPLFRMNEINLIHFR